MGSVTADFYWKLSTLGLLDAVGNPCELMFSYDVAPLEPLARPFDRDGLQGPSDSISAQSKRTACAGAPKLHRVDYHGRLTNLLFTQNQRAPYIVSYHRRPI